MKNALAKEDSKKALELLAAIFTAIPYTLQQDANEAYYHSLFILTMNLLGIKLDPERLHDKRRCDGVLHLGDKIFILEFKYATKGTMKNLLSQADDQIKLRRYYEPFLGEGKKVLTFCVGFLQRMNKEGKKEMSIDGTLNAA